MINKIIDALNTTGISLWRIEYSNTSSCELFFVKKELDLRRVKDVSDGTVYVFRDFEKDGKPMRGFANFTVHPGMAVADIAARAKSAYFAASFVCNPFFELADPVQEPTSPAACDFDCESAALIMAEALYKADCHERGFVNSAEIFAEKSFKRIIASNGTDVNFNVTRVKGEFVVQCKQPQDVEQYRDFAYDRLSPAELTSKVNQAIIAVEDRANATESAPAGVYDIVLLGDHVRTILGYYLERAEASSIFAGYSDFQVGQSVQGENPVGEKLELSLVPTTPFSDEGVRMTERKLTEAGKLCCIPGNTRFCRYLGVEPTGQYSKLRLDCGSTAFDEMKKGCLVPVSFSDFQMDPFTGHFGGEIRLAYLYDENGNKQLVTGGSINGEIFSVQGDLGFSLERYADLSYEGPYAIKVKGVNVAG